VNRARILDAVVSRVLEFAQTSTGQSELERLEHWASQASPDSYQQSRIRGFALAGYQYLRMLFGANTAKPDVHICRYVSRALARKVSDLEALNLLEAASKISGVSLRDLDTTIWETSARLPEGTNQRVELGCQLGVVPAKPAYLYETHVPVADTETSAKFYVDIVGLKFAYRDPGRDIVFLWIGPDRKSMLGLWGPTTTYGRDPHRCHFALALSLPELLAAGPRLNRLGVATRNFAGEETTEPSVIGWMPSAQLYFRDPDGHSLEFIALLDDPPDAQFIGPLSEWRKAG
jgi:lactoylglutathione lyase